MEYLHVLLRAAAEPWAIEPTKLSEILAFILFKADGGMLSAAEVEARQISARRERDIAESPGKIGILPVSGLIMPRVSNMRASESGTPLDALMKDFRSMQANDEIKVIIGDFDSPGGQTGGLDEAAQEIFESRGNKPMIAQVNTLAASAAYYLATQFDEIVVTPSGRAGSIGVYTMHDDISKALEARGITRTVIRSGPNKAQNSPFAPLSEEGRSKLEKMVSFANDQFVSAVARGRSVPQKTVNEKFGAGDMFDPPELVKRGMADRVGSMKDTLARFGVELSPIKKSAAKAARVALARGEIPAKSDFEAFLREAVPGVSKSLASRIANAGLPSTQSESEIDEASRSESGATAAILDKGLASLRSGADALRALTVKPKV